MGERCKTKYPILLVHGTGFRDRKYLCYWGRIPKVLENEGAEIYYGHQDSWATVEENAKIVQGSIEKAIRESGSEKLNVIAHSKGGLEIRYCVSTLGMGHRIASVTTIGTPHRGSYTMDRVCRLPMILFRPVSFFANLWFRILGDNNPDFYAVCRQFTTAYTDAFNRENPDIEGIYYQSYAGVMKGVFSDMVMVIPYLFVKHNEGENDGLVSLRSAKWSNFRGTLRGGTNRGISHADEVDIRRMRLSKTKKEGCISDICDFYLDMISELKEMGY